MSLWRRLRNWWDNDSAPEEVRASSETDESALRSYALSEDFLRSLHDLAVREQRSPEEVAQRMLRRAVEERKALDHSWTCWNALSPREKDVVALVCLQYTSRQIAARLGISPETVKTHVENALEKFGIRRRAELREILVEWDFSAWEKK